MATPLLRRLQSQNSHHSHQEQQQSTRTKRPLPPIPQQQQPTPLASTSRPPPLPPPHPPQNHHHHYYNSNYTQQQHQPAIPQLVFNNDDPEQQKENLVVSHQIPTILTPQEDQEDQEQEHGGRKNKKPFIENNHPQPNVIIPQRRISSQTKTNTRSIPQMIFTTDEDDGEEVPCSSHDPIKEPSTLKPTGQINSLVCSGCRQIIAGRIVHALNQRWHPDCFTCHHCRLALEHVAFYEHEGKAYCGVDYDELFSLKCYHCNTSINEDSYVTLDDPSLEGGPRHYHKLHLFCSECGDPFINPKSLEERSRISTRHGVQHQQEVVTDGEGIGQNEAEEPKPFVLFKGFPYCELCDIKLHRPKCSHCKLPVVDDLIHAINKTFHSNCFVCFVCHLPFPNNQFFLIDLDQLQDLDDPNHKQRFKKKFNQQVPICLNCYS